MEDICKVALITGATGGIGRATALAFARKGLQWLYTMEEIFQK
jgi:NAD(P)-dependent dehydrogenase (short-subunit alcohol dehydrogenase family)